MNKTNTLLNTVLKIMVLIITGYSAQVWSECMTINQYTVQIPLQNATISAGDDLPVGSILFQQRFYGLSPVTYYNCGTYIYLDWRLIGGTLYPGQSNIYQTGVSGIGVQFLQPREGITIPARRGTGGLGNGSNATPDGWLAFIAQFIKMGPITPGNINGISLPEVRTYITDETDVLVRMSFVSWNGGAVAVQAPTCTTPNFNYDLGSYSSQSFTGVNSTTEWKDAQLRLTGCSVFRGNYRNGGDNYPVYTSTGLNTGTFSNTGSRLANTLTVTLSPNTAIIDASKGIIATETGAGNSTGIGLQIGSRTGTSGSYLPMDITTGTSVSPALDDSSGIVTFNLGARYIQTVSRVTPGKANASLVYTINYN